MKRLYSYLFCSWIYIVFNAAMLIFIIPCQVGAQSQDESKEQHIRLKTDGVIMSPRKVGGDDASVTTTSANFEATYEYGNANLTVNYDLHQYDWDKVDELPFGNGKDDPWSTLHRLGATLGYNGTIHGRWGYFVGGYSGLSYENEVDDAFNVIGYGGLTCSITKEWFLSAGAGYKYHHVNSFVLPVFGISYISKSIKGLEMQLKFPFASVSYRFNKWLGLRMFGNYEYGMYALRKDSPAVSKGFLEICGYRSGMYLDIWPAQMFQFSIGCVYDFAGNYSLYKANGSRIKRYDRGEGIGGALQLKASF